MNDQEMAVNLRRLMSKGGSKGFMLCDQDSEDDWKQANAMEAVGLLEYKGVYTGTGTFALTQQGEALLGSEGKVISFPKRP